MVTRWKADTPAIEAAAAVLKLRHGVHIIPARMLTARGRYTGIARGYHEIRVHTQQRSDAASRVIWHELVHAKQRERHRTDPDYLAWYTAQFRRAGIPCDFLYNDHTVAPSAYRTVPAEAEAHAFEALHDTLPLALAGQPSDAWARSGKTAVIRCA